MSGAVLLLLESEWCRRSQDDRADRLIAALAALGEITLCWMGELPEERASVTWLGVVRRCCMVGAAAEEISPEAVAAWVVEHAAPFTHIAVADSTLGLAVLPRVAALLDREMLTGVQQIVTADTFRVPCLSGHLLTTMQVEGRPVCLALQPFSFEPVARVQASEGALQQVSLPPYSGAARRLSRLPLQTQDRVDLATAQRVVAGGGGLLKAGSFALIEALADHLGAAVGASRAAVDGGLVDSTVQIGQTGQVIAPDLYIGIGISGAIAHLAGIKQAKTIVAINSDPLAPLMQIADWSLQGDLYEVVAEWLAEKT
ncbi:MAG: electron transfer flavoprotein subunit alpha/FixB family protein [Magnetococcales bacterium]|nr:electron transfer flavoprotein subunit alpha/FixB family protein [Magnetococcales bacterium]MBF0116079.1 electron transfer flavoprotein subunit alpha/FixB family protein [Magnetococcales bacterium]